MSEPINEQELLQYLKEKTGVDANSIELVLRHEQAFIQKQASKNSKGDIEIDIDDLVDYVSGRPDVKLDELAIETILEAEMDYLTDAGLAGYLD
ncbi:hypothetical protein [Paenibacillus sp. NPDC058071]|uniref:hypothetical protein n=1 Tax=Paenibacillus sp. NPDC058071 TaxID=3346326 RepID=UPI0036DAD033